MNLYERILPCKPHRYTFARAPLKSTQFDIKGLAKGLLALLFFAAAIPGFALPQSARARSFKGIIASFKIQNPIIKIGEDLKIVVVYRNTGNNKVHFRFFHLDENADVYKKGEDKPIIGGFTGEPAPLETTLNPGESLRFEDVFDMKGFANF